jgi:membrane protein implicated in regulation of membrane protease activity
MNVKKYYYIVIAILILLILLAIAVSAEFSLNNITSDPYGFTVRFLELWAPALGAIGTVIVAIVIIMVLNYIRRSQEREKEQLIHALHDEININLSIIKPLRHRIETTLEPYSTEARLGLLEQDRQSLFEVIDTTVFDNIKNDGNLRWMDSTRTKVISCYTLIKRYNRDQYYQEGHPSLLSRISTQLQSVQKNLEETFDFLPRYSKEKTKTRTKREDEEDLVETESSFI